MTSHEIALGEDPREGRELTHAAIGLPGAAGAEGRPPRAAATASLAAAAAPVDRPAPDRRSDFALSEAVAARIAVPKRDEADSFVLHAPLELLARTALLPLVHPHAREAARARLAWLGETYAAAGPEVEHDAGATSRPRSYDSAAAAASTLASAIDAGDLDGVDAPAQWLAAALPAADLSRALADPVLPRLGAAAHGAIFLWQLPRVAPRSAAAARMLRGLVRELARESEWRLAWYRERTHATEGRRTGAASSDDARGDARDLVEVLLRPPSPGDPGSPFIIPTMSLVERSGLAARLLDAPTRSLDVPAAARALARVAAWSMLQDDPAHAPYGWTHCLSMPQATLGIAGACARPSDAIAVAATYALGFRATLGSVALDRRWTPERPPGRDPLASLDGTPGEAAAAVWHAPSEAMPQIVATIATRAAIHHDAHLAKYTVACLDAAHADPAATRLYLAAAAYLAAWWAAQPDAQP